MNEFWGLLLPSYSTEPLCWDCVVAFSSLKYIPGTLVLIAPRINLCLILTRICASYSVTRSVKLQINFGITVTTWWHQIWLKINCILKLNAHKFEIYNFETRIKFKFVNETQAIQHWHIFINNISAWGAVEENDRVFSPVSHIWHELKKNWTIFRTNGGSYKYIVVFSYKFHDLYVFITLVMPSFNSFVAWNLKCCDWHTTVVQQHQCSQLPLPLPRLSIYIVAMVRPGRIIFSCVVGVVFRII